MINRRKFRVYFCLFSFGLAECVSRILFTEKWFSHTGKLLSVSLLCSQSIVIPFCFGSLVDAHCQCGFLNWSTRTATQYVVRAEVGEAQEQTTTKLLVVWWCCLFFLYFNFAAALVERQPCGRGKQNGRAGGRTGGERMSIEPQLSKDRRDASWITFYFQFDDLDSPCAVLRYAALCCDLINIHLSHRLAPQSSSIKFSFAPSRIGSDRFLLGFSRLVFFLPFFSFFLKLFLSFLFLIINTNGHWFPFVLEAAHNITTPISFYSPISSCRQASLTDIRLGVQRQISLLSNLGIGSCAPSSRSLRPLLLLVLLLILLLLFLLCSLDAIFFEWNVSHLK